MKTTALLLLIGWAALASSCGQDAASKKMAADTQAQVVASIKQILVTSRDTSSLGPVRTWYQSEVPNIIKLDPGAAAVYRDHATLLQQVATDEPQLTSAPILTAEQSHAIRRTYQKLVDESTANVTQLTSLANSKTTMSEAEQRKFVADLATKEKHQLELTQYFSKRTFFTVNQATQKKKSDEYNLKTYGHY
jgi:hypothetical protein